MAVLPNWEVLAATKMKIGCASITWGDKFIDCIKEVGPLGYRGVQLRGNAYNQYKDKVKVLNEILKVNRMNVPIMSSGNVSLDPLNQKSDFERHMANAKWVKSIGGKYMQITFDGRPNATGIQSKEDCQRAAMLGTEIGKGSADLGIRTLHHNHMGHLGQMPEEVKMIHDAADRKHMGLLLDVAHYAQGGGSPEKDIAEYGSLLELVHLKDLIDTAPNEKGKSNYQFVELGKGKVNLDGVLAALAKIGFAGWAMVELDAVPRPGDTPLSCATTSANFLKAKNIL